jgi:hypothetical protein
MHALDFRSIYAEGGDTAGLGIQDGGKDARE